MNNVIVTYQGLMLRGKIVGVSPTHYAVDVWASDIPVLRGIGYNHPCVIVAKNQVKAR